MVYSARISAYSEFIGIYVPCMVGIKEDCIVIYYDRVRIERVSIQLVKPAIMVMFVSSH